MERGESYLTYNQSFIKIGPKLRDLWYHLSPKLLKNFESERLWSDILDFFTINFQPIAMICNFLERGESYLTYNQSFHQNRTKTERLMGPLIAKTIKKVRVRGGFCLIFCVFFYYQFPTDCHDLYIFGKGGVLPNIQSKFIKIGPKLRDLWDHLSPKLFKKLRVREAFCLIFWIFYYQFPTDCHELYIFWKGGSLTYTQSKFHQNRTNN